MVLASLKSGPLPELLEAFPGLSYEFGGATREQAKSMGSLSRGGLLAMIAIFGVLFATFIILLLVPAYDMMLEDFLGVARRLRGSR